MKIKFNSDDDLPQKKTLQLYNMVIVVGSVFDKGNKDYVWVKCWLDWKMWNIINSILSIYIKMDKNFHCCKNHRVCRY